MHKIAYYNIMCINKYYVCSYISIIIILKSRFIFVNRDQDIIQLTLSLPVEGHTIVKRKEVKAISR